MDYWCELCDILIKLKSKHEHFKSNTYKEFDKGKRKELTFANPDVNDIDNACYAYNIQRNKKQD